MEENKNNTDVNTAGCGNPNCTCDPCMCEPVCNCGEELSQEQQIVRLETELFAAQKLAEENLNLAKYTRAEFENFRKRERDSAVNAMTDGKIYVILNILPVFDSITEAMKLTNSDDDRDGIKILYRKFESILTSLGLEEVKALGEKFDPNVHNCISRGKYKDREPDIVAKEWQKGYKFAGKLIRPATVTVSE